MRALLLLVLGTAILLPAPAPAQTPGPRPSSLVSPPSPRPAPPAPAYEPREPSRYRLFLRTVSDTNWWDTRHEMWSSNIVAAVERFDRFFGDPRLDEENTGTRLKLGLGLEFVRGEDPKLDHKFSARLALPALERRIHVVVDNAFEAEDPAQGSTVETAAKESEPNTGLRYILREERFVRISLDGGVRFSDELQIYAKLRGRKIIPLDPWELYVSQLFEWFSVDGWKETTEMRWSRWVWQHWLFRSTTDLLWEEKEDGTTPSQSFGVFRALGRKTAHKVAVSGSWPEFPHTHNASYALEYGYRRLIYRDWLFAELTPGVKFPQDEDYEITPYFTIMFEAILGDVR